MRRNLKVYLYTNNHDTILGIIDYIDYFKKLSKKFNFKLTIGRILPNKNKYDFVIFIEEFSKIREFLKIFYFLKTNPTKTILVLTEFFNEKEKTLNYFENSHSYLTFFSKYFYILNYILNKLFYNLIKIFFNYLYILISYLKFPINLISKFLFFIISKIQKFIEKFFLICRNCILYISSEIKKKGYRDYYKTRFVSLCLLIDFFNFCIRSHSAINYKKKKFLDILFFFEKNVKINKNKKFSFEFSGDLNCYRRNILKRILINEKKYRNIDLNNIKKTLLLPLGFYTFNLKNKNYLSLHPKKSNLWPYCSPTRYINSINKNYIPIVTDNFKDKVSAFLTVHISELQGRSENFLYNLDKRFKKNLNKYKLLADKAASKIYNKMTQIAR